MSNTLSTQPNDHLGIIFSFLTGADLLRCLSISHRMAKFAKKQLPSTSVCANAELSDKLSSGGGMLLYDIIDKYLIPGVTSVQIPSVRGHHIDGEFIPWVSKRCGKLLRMFEIPCCIMIDDRAIINLTASCPNLTHLDISRGFTITTNSLIILAERCNNLTHLNVSWCHSICDVGIGEVLSGCKLTSLDVSGCSGLSGKLFNMLVNKNTVTHLNVSYCSWVTTAGVKYLLYNSTVITRLNVTQCHWVDIDTLSDNKKDHPRIELIY